MTRTLIIGGTRFLGPKIIELLLERGDDVTIFNRGNNYGNAVPNAVKVIRGDRTKRTDLRKVLTTSFDYIYDLCAYDHDDVEKVVSQVSSPAHIIFLSTAAVYKKPMVYPLDEQSETGPWPSFGEYGVNKAIAEQDYIHFATQHATKVTIFRPVYLLGEHNYFDREHYYFSRIVHGAPIIVPGNGNALMQFAFVGETARALVEIPPKQQSTAEVLNVGGNECITNNSFIELCAHIVGKAAKVMHADALTAGIDEEAFYDDVYPFPNLNFIVSNYRITHDYDIAFQSLQSGLEAIYTHDLADWSKPLHTYPKELAILKKLGS